MTGLQKILIIILLSTFKFLLAPALAFGMGLSFLQTLLSTTTGGIVGVVVFFFCSRWIIEFYSNHFAYYFHRLRVRIHNILNLAVPKFIPTRRFTKRNRLMIKMVRKYGLAGIVILTPILLSIPFGTFLATRYYASNRFLLIYLSCSVFFWSLFMSSAISLF